MSLVTPISISGSIGGSLLGKKYTNYPINAKIPLLRFLTSKLNIAQMTNNTFVHGIQTLQDILLVYYCLGMGTFLLAQESSAQSLSSQRKLQLLKQTGKFSSSLYFLSLLGELAKLDKQMKA